MTEDKQLGDYFEQVIALSPTVDRRARAKGASNWVLSEVVRLLNANGVAVSDSPLPLNPLLTYWICSIPSA